MKVHGKVWVVTGAGSGMGRELVLALLDRGARVAAVDRNGDGLAAVAEAAGAGDRLSTHVADITDRDAVTALPAAVEAAHGAVDGLVNNAGIIQPFVPVVDLDDAAIERVMAVNYFGTLAMTRAFLPVLLRRPEAHIANVASMGGFFPFPGQTVYGASKAAVKLLTEGLYAELLDTDVRVTVIFPGAVDTSITENSGLDRPEESEVEGAAARMTSAPDAARAMLAGIERDRLHVYVGTDAKLMSLAIKLAPRPAIRFVKKQMSRHVEALAPAGDTAARRPASS
ncbi:SDR family NAD(P)-dependent oxidoreductase [Nocardioides sp. SYSU DS0651]|uniref:SDR family NAD(P)-dependent oxidoreductase n=1 Tax=Nocardioides sp. SYSU DS0651 TaxID=3415955 RepID=UPI003F4C081F